MTTLKLYPVYHALCGQVAFYTSRFLGDSDDMVAGEFYLPNGSQPENGDEMICGHCHNSTMDCFYDMPFSYKDDQPVEVTFDQVKT